ncbi:hypothetical protein Tco_1457698 [Tanacetum coccineum]
MELTKLTNEETVIRSLEMMIDLISFKGDVSTRKIDSALFGKKEELYAKFSSVKFLDSQSSVPCALILALPEGSEDFIAYCDASIKGLERLSVLIAKRKVNA